MSPKSPAIDLEIRHPSAANDQQPESGAVDLLLAPRHASGAGIVCTAFYDDDYVCMVSDDSPHRRLTVERYMSMSYALVAPRERPGAIVEEVFTREHHGFRRRVAHQVPTFLVLPHVLVGAPHVATVPQRLARSFCRRYPLRMLKPPVAIPGLTIYQAWHELHRNDPGHRWLRSEIARIATAFRGRVDADA